MTQTHPAQEDLAFLRGLVEDNGRGQMSFGAIYLAGGVLYPLQLLVSWAQWTGAMSLTAQQNTALIAGVNLVFAAVVIGATWRYRKARAGLAARGVNAAFGGIGVAAMALLALFAIVAMRHHELRLWLMYPVVAFALQGGGWLSGYILRRKGWMLAVSAGWLATAAGMALTLEGPTYALIAAVGMIAFMAVPGVHLLRTSRAPA